MYLILQDYNPDYATVPSYVNIDGSMAHKSLWLVATISARGALNLYNFECIVLYLYAHKMNT